MKLTVGWWRARDGSKWYVDWVGKKRATAYNEDDEETLLLTAEGKYRLSNGEPDEWPDDLRVRQLPEVVR